MFDSLKEVLGGRLKANFTKPITDNVIFKLHYKITFTVMMLFVLLVTQRQYIGEHIKCISDEGVVEAVINTYCFFSGTFTVVKHLNETELVAGNIPHPGVGPVVEEDETILHAYYQWVPFILFVQAFCFYLPHAIWKHKEGGRIGGLSRGLRLAYVPECEKDEEGLVGEKTINHKIELCESQFQTRVKKLTSWTLWLIFCEFLNLVNLILQIYFTDLFLGGRFMAIGSDVANTEDWDGYLDPLDAIFPKVTKCTFYKYGPGGGIQNHDALCVMALNVIHEKIYTILWFWYSILFSFTILGLIIRLVMLLLHGRSMSFNKLMFRFACPMKYDIEDIRHITNRYNFAGWLFLFYLGKNMTPYAFKKFLNALRKEKETTPEVNIKYTKDNKENEQMKSLL